MLRINADAVVLDSEDDVSRLCPAFGFDGAIFWRIFDGIVYEILQDLSEKIFFCKQLRRCRPYDLHKLLLFLCLGQKFLHREFQHAACRERLLFHIFPQFPAVKARELEQGRNESVHSLSFMQDDLAAMVADVW